jgi:hypothetical protein
MTGQRTGAHNGRPAFPTRHFGSRIGRDCGAGGFEIFANADKSQAKGFFRAVGKRLAEQNPIPAMRDLRELQGAVNAVWGRLGLGEADITLDLQGVLINHHDAPAAIPNDPEFNWGDALASLLVGAYDGWMRAMGSPDALVTRVVSYSANSIEIRHGAEI